MSLADAELHLWLQRDVNCSLLQVAALLSGDLKLQLFPNQEENTTRIYWFLHAPILMQLAYLFVAYLLFQFLVFVKYLWCAKYWWTEAALVARLAFQCPEHIDSAVNKWCGCLLACVRANGGHRATTVTVSMSIQPCEHWVIWSVKTRPRYDL